MKAVLSFVFYGVQVATSFSGFNQWHVFVRSQSLRNFKLVIGYEKVNGYLPFGRLVAANSFVGRAFFILMLQLLYFEIFLLYPMKSKNK